MPVPCAPGSRSATPTSSRKLPEGFTVPEGRVKPWGTAHAILVAEEAIGDAPFAVI